MKLSAKPLFFLLLLLSACAPNTPKQAVDDNPLFKQEPTLIEISKKIATYPTHADLYFERGQRLHKLKQDTLALKDFVKATQLDSTQADYFSAVGDILFENKDLDGSVVWLEKAIKINPANATARLKIAKLFLYIAQHDKAIDQINIVLRKDIYNPEAYYLKGMVYKDRKDTLKAISCFSTALQVVPDYQPAIIQLGLLYSYKKDSLALQYLDNALNIDSTDKVPFFAKGLYYENIKQYSKAIECFKQCIIKDRHYIDAYFKLGYLYMQQDSIEKSYHQIRPHHSATTLQCRCPLQ